MERALNSKVGVAAIIVGSIFLLTAGAAFAAGTAKGEAMELRTPSAGPTAATLVSTDTISYTQNMTGGVMIPTCIGLFFGVDMTDVVTIRSEEGLGWGEVAKVYFFATESMTDVSYILDLRAGGLGYGQIAKVLDLSPGRHGQNLGCIVSGRCAVSDTVPMSGTVPVGAQRLADRLGADAEDMAAMLDDGATNGTVIVAHKLAGQFPDETTPEDLVARRLAGESWGQIRRSLKDSTSTSASGLSTPGGGKSHGNQGHHGKPENKGNQGRALGHDKEHGHGGGKKH